MDHDLDQKKDGQMSRTPALQEIYNRTFLYAAEAHHGQLFPGTELPYIVHVAMVANEVIFAHQEEAVEEIDIVLQVALLHDVLEDTPITARELSLHFEQSVVDGVVLLSKRYDDRKLSFAEYVDRLKGAAKGVVLVKLCDRTTNLQRPPKFWTVEKISAYLHESEMIFNTLGPHHFYAAKRLALKMENYRQYLCSS